MRVMMRVLCDVAASNRAFREGKMNGLIEDFVKIAKPEGMWFGAMDGKRGMVAVFDLASNADMPRIGEPFFDALNATIEMFPVMDLADLQKGMSAI